MTAVARHEETHTVANLSMFTGFDHQTVQQAVQRLSARGLVWVAGRTRYGAQVLAFDRAATPPVDERGITRRALDALARARAARSVKMQGLRNG